MSVSDIHNERNSILDTWAFSLWDVVQEGNTEPLAAKTPKQKIYIFF